MHKLAERSSGALLVAFRPEISNERVTRDPTLSGSSEYQQKCQCLALTRDGVHAPSAALEKASAKCVKPDHSALFFRIHGNLTLDLRDDSRYRAFNTRIHSADWTEASRSSPASQPSSGEFSCVTPFLSQSFPFPSCLALAVPRRTLRA